MKYEAMVINTKTVSVRKFIVEAENGKNAREQVKATLMEGETIHSLHCEVIKEKKTRMLKACNVRYATVVMIDGKLAFEYHEQQVVGTDGITGKDTDHNIRMYASRNGKPIPRNSYIESVTPIEGGVAKRTKEVAE